MKKNNAGTYESKEELWISYYLDELLKVGFILDWKYQPRTYTLSKPLSYAWIKKLPTKNKFQSSNILQGHEYTPDFMIIWNESARNLFFNSIEDKINLKGVNFIAHSGNNLSVIDVKPQFDMQNMTRLFIINQKWMMDKYGLYIQKIIPIKETKHKQKSSTWSGIFPKTFTPERYFFTDISMKSRKINYKAIRLNDYLELMKKDC